VNIDDIFELDKTEKLVEYKRQVIDVGSKFSER
jgi:hypothetical protein